MKLKFKLTAIAMVIGVCLLVLALPSVSKASQSLLIHPKYLKGVDTIILRSPLDVGPANFLSTLANSAELDSWVYDAFSAMFASMPQIKITAYRTSSDRQSNSIIVSYYLSVREEMVKGKLVKTAALAVQFRQSFYYDPPDNFSPSRTVVYPFLVPETKEELEVKIKDGVRYLADFFPSILCYEINSSSNDCRLTDAKPYAEKLPSATAPKKVWP